MDDNSQMLSLRAATRAAGVSRNTLRKAIREDRLRARPLNDGTWGIHADDLAAWQLDRLPLYDSVTPPKTPPQPAAGDAATPEEPVDRLEQALREAQARIAMLEAEHKGARAVMMEVRELIEVQAQRIDDLKADRAHMVALLRQAHERITAIDSERRSLFDRLLSIIDSNIPAAPKDAGTARRERH